MQSLLNQIINGRSQHAEKFKEKNYLRPAKSDCGIISHKMLEGAVIEGTREMLVFKELKTKLEKVNIKSPNLTNEIEAAFNVSRI